MTDATKLYKGAVALRKGIAMFAWLRDVEAALKEVPELEKTLWDLKVEINESEKERDRLHVDLSQVRDTHSGAKAQAEKIISDAKGQASSIITIANAKIINKVSAAEAELAALRKTIDKELTEHNKEMAEHLRARSYVKAQVDELNAELAAIKARRGDLATPAPLLAPL